MIFILLACGDTTTPSHTDRPKEEIQVPAHTSTPLQVHTKKRIDTLVQTLSTREQQISCSILTHEKTLKTDLTTIVDTIERPPWVPMRAATCLAELFPIKSQSDLSRWISDPQKKGLAFLIAGLVPNLPDDVARSVVEKGLNGPHEAQVRMRLTKQKDPRSMPLLSNP